MRATNGQKRVEAVLPYNTPSKLFDEVSSRVFHPAALPFASDKKSSTMKLPTCFTGHGSIAVPARMKMDVTVMVGEENTPANLALIECTNLFIDPANPFAGVTVQRTNHKSIEGQLFDFFRFSDCDEAMVIWPYQTFSLADNDNAAAESGMNLFMAPGEAQFAYTHHLLNMKRENIPGGIAIAPKPPAPESSDTDENEIECAVACSVGTVDEMLRGSFNRVLSIVQIDRAAFNFWWSQRGNDDIASFLGEYLKGKRGILVNPKRSSFLI